MANTVELIIGARDQGASATLRTVSKHVGELGQATRALDTRGTWTQFLGDIQRLGEATRNSKGDVVSYGQAWGTAGGFIKKGSADSTGALDGFDKAAKTAARGGIQELASQIPVVGSTLGQLAGTLSGLPLAIGGVVGAGVGLILFFEKMAESSAAAITAVSRLSMEVETNFTHAMLESRKTIAAANQDQAQVIALTYRQEVADARAAALQKIDIAQNEFDTINSAFFTTGEERIQAREKLDKAIQAANDEASNKEIEANGRRVAAIIELDQRRVDFARKLSADLIAAQSEVTAANLKLQGQELAAIQTSTEGKLATLRAAHQEELQQIDRLYAGTVDGLERRRQAEEAFQAKSVKLQQDGDAQKKASIETTTTAALAIFQDLGSGFQKVQDALSLDKFVRESDESIKSLKALAEVVGQNETKWAQYGVRIKDVTDAIQRLTQAQQQAINRGMAPTKQAAEEVSAAHLGLSHSVGLAGQTIRDTGESVEAYDRALDKSKTTTEDLSLSTEALIKDIGAMDRVIKQVQSREQQVIGTAGGFIDSIGGVQRITNSTAGAVNRLTGEVSELARGFRSGIFESTAMSASLEELLRTTSQFFGIPGGLEVNVSGAINAILNQMRAAAQAQKLVDDFLERIFHPKKVGVLDPTQEATDALQRQAEQLRAQIRYNEAYGLSVEALTRQLAALELQIERVAAAEALRAFGGPTTLGVQRDVSPGGVQRSHIGTGNWSTGGGIQAAAGPPPGSSGTPGNAAGGISVTINAAPGQSPQDIAKAVVPAIRRATQRGTV